MGIRKFDNLDEFASQYRAIHTDNIKSISGVDSDYFSEYKVIEVCSCEKFTGTKVVLDFGCGDGNSAKYFLEYLDPDSYQGIDISSDSIECAKQNHFERCDFSLFDGASIPFDDATFDIIFMACVLHHIDSSFHKIVINECHRVLKRGGRLYIFEHNNLNPLTRKLVKDCPFDVDAELVPISNLLRITREVGFEHTDRRYTIFFPRGPLFKYFVPLEKYLRWCPLGGQYYVRCHK